MSAEPLKPGECRIVESLPCPLDWYHHPNEYWLLRRAARRLIERNADSFWKYPEKIETVMEAFHLLKSIADTIPSKPSKAWESGGYGIVREICCPYCFEVFRWSGNFYVPRCLSCQKFLREKKPEATL